MKKAWFKTENYIPFALVFLLVVGFLLSKDDLATEHEVLVQIEEWSDTDDNNAGSHAFDISSNSILSVGRKPNLSKSYPDFEVSLLAKGKRAQVKIKDSHEKLLTIKTSVKQDKRSKRTAKYDNDKFSLSSVISSWQPKDQKLAGVYGKVYRSGALSEKAVINAFKYYEKYKGKHGLSNNYLVVADYTKAARNKRMHLINLQNGKISSYHVAHGKRSGPVGGRVYATSNRPNSYMTSKGFFKVGYKEGRTLKKGYKYLSVTGLERANRKVGLPTRHGGRDVVIHTASYVNNGGRSFGCFSIRPQDRRPIFSRIKGALFYSYTGNV